MKNSNNYNLLKGNKEYLLLVECNFIVILLSSDGETIIALKSGGEKMGQRDGFSNVDLLKANKLYNCEQSGDIGPTPAPGGDGSGIGGSGIGGSGGGGGSTTVDCTDQKWSCFAWSMLGKCKQF